MDKKVISILIGFIIGITISGIVYALFLNNSEQSKIELQKLNNMETMLGKKIWCVDPSNVDTGVYGEITGFSVKKDRLYIVPIEFWTFSTLENEVNTVIHNLYFPKDYCSFTRSELPK